MRPLIVLCITWLLAGCVTGEYYHPDVPRSDMQSIGSSCGANYKQVRRELGEGIILEVSGGAAGVGPVEEFRLSWSFRLGYGHSVKLNSKIVRVTILDDGLEKELSVEKITYVESNLKDFGHIAPLDPMEGTGKTDHVELGWGEYSYWYGDGDVYSVEILGLGYAPERVEVRLPTIVADGRNIEIKPIRFTKIEDSQICVQ